MGKAMVVSLGLLVVNLDEVRMVEIPKDGTQRWRKTPEFIPKIPPLYLRPRLCPHSPTSVLLKLNISGILAEPFGVPSSREPS